MKRFIVACVILLGAAAPAQGQLAMPARVEHQL